MWYSCPYVSAISSGVSPRCCAATSTYVLVGVSWCGLCGMCKSGTPCCYLAFLTDIPRTQHPITSNLTHPPTSDGLSHTSPLTRQHFPQPVHSNRAPSTNQGASGGGGRDDASPPSCGFGNRDDCMRGGVVVGRHRRVTGRIRPGSGRGLLLGVCVYGGVRTYVSVCLEFNPSLSISKLHSDAPELEGRDERRGQQSENDEKKEYEGPPLLYRCSVQ